MMRVGVRVVVVMRALYDADELFDHQEGQNAGQHVQTDGHVVRVTMLMVVAAM